MTEHEIAEMLALCERLNRYVAAIVCADHDLKVGQAMCANAMTAAAAAIEALLAERERLREGLVFCHHEPYQGRCAHCDVPFKGGFPEIDAALSPEPTR